MYFDGRRSYNQEQCQIWPTYINTIRGRCKLTLICVHFLANVFISQDHWSSILNKKIAIRSAWVGTLRAHFIEVLWTRIDTWEETTGVSKCCHSFIRVLVGGWRKCRNLGPRNIDYTGYRIVPHGIGKINITVWFRHGVCCQYTS